MGKKHPPIPQSPASRPGAAAPKLEPEPAAVVDAAAAAAPEPVSAASDAEDPTTPAPEPEPAPAAVVDAAAAAAPEPASAASDAEEPSTPDPDPEPEPPAALRCRVNWHFAGFRERDLHEGDEVDTDEAEAAPYLGGVLTRLEAAE